MATVREVVVVLALAAATLAMATVREVVVLALAAATLAMATVRSVVVLALTAVATLALVRHDSALALVRDADKCDRARPIDRVGPIVVLPPDRLKVVKGKHRDER